MHMGHSPDIDQIEDGDTGETFGDRIRERVESSRMLRHEEEGMIADPFTA